MQKDCDYCYKPLIKHSACGKCLKRNYCSKQCQVQDWKRSHKICCSKTGEQGDWAIKQCTNASKGKGLFAQKDFNKYDIIMVERIIVSISNLNSGIGTSEIAKLSASELLAIKQLHPETGNASIQTKVLANIMGTLGAESVLCIHMSRVNHDCVGNAVHYFDSDKKLKLLIATRNIKSGEEITMSYLPTCITKQNRQLRLYTTRQFTCNCELCSLDDEQSKKLDDAFIKMKELDDKIMRYGQMGNITQSIRCVEQLIKLYDQNSDYITELEYKRTYYDAFQVCITTNKYINKGKQYIKKAYNMESTFFQNYPTTIAELVKTKSFLDAPHSHRNWKLLSK